MLTQKFIKMPAHGHYNETGTRYYLDRRQSVSLRRLVITRFFDAIC